MEARVTIGSRLITRHRLFIAALCAGVLAGAAPSQAADIYGGPRAATAHVRTSHIYYGNWRERCAYAGYYCLYAEYGYVYHYPFDDRPIAHRHNRRIYR
jgi:hypothetical protein